MTHTPVTPQESGNQSETNPTRTSKSHAGLTFVPTKSPEDWKRFLASPDKQWEPGYSAHTLAHSWDAAPGFPPEIAAALAPAFPGVELLMAIPEWKVDLPGRGPGSHNDAFALARTDRGLLTIAIEGKVDEPLGPTIGEWLSRASENKKERLDGLVARLGLDETPPDSIRYQLLHRTASALIEAERFHAAHAVMLVHSFSETSKWHDDFLAFAGLFGVSPAAGEVVAVPTAGPATLHLGWVSGDQKFRRR